ncbi:MAG: peptidase M28, partial [Acidobacteria bacterium]|nr:peptidase M28 [Acidobacteriota bacterium]
MIPYRVHARRKVATGFLLASLLLPRLTAQAEPEVVDLTMIHRIRAEAIERSQVMEHLFYLTDVSGPRITNSPGYDAAANWAMARFGEYGMANVHKEKWGPFGRGWTFDRFSAHLLSPQYAPLVGFPLAWSPSTNGQAKARAIYAPITTAADFERWKGKLRGAIVLIDPARPSTLSLAPLARRYTDAELDEMSRL